MRKDGEENLGNHDNLTESNSSHSSSESHWEESQEVIPTFFSTMNTRYCVLCKIIDSWTPASLLESQSWCSFQEMAYSNRIEIMVYQVSTLLLTLSEAVDERELDCESILYEQILVSFDELSLGNVFIGLHYNRKTITGKYL